MYRCPNWQLFDFVEPQLRRAEDLFTMDKMGTSWGYLSQAIDGSMLTAMQSLSALFQMNNVMTMPADPLEDLNEMVNELIEALDSDGCDLEPAAKQFIRSRLDEILDAIAEFDKFGPEHLSDVLIEATGTVVVEAQRLGRNDKDPTWQRFYAILARIADVCGIAAFAGLSLTMGQASPPTMQVPPAVVVIQPSGDVNVRTGDGDIVEAEIVDEP